MLDTSDTEDHHPQPIRQHRRRPNRGRHVYRILLWPGNLAIGVGDIQSNQFITTPAPDQVQARCIGAGDNLTIGITAPNGWNALLTHGSQTIAIENKELDYPLQEFTTPQGALDSESESNNISGTTDLFPPGVTWDLPQLGDVEIQLSQKTPPHWQIRARRESPSTCTYDAKGRSRTLKPGTIPPRAI